MTIEELIECDAAKLEAMSDQELLQHFEKYLNVTRPERQPARTTTAQNVVKANPKLQQGLALAKQLGLDADLNMFAPMKRKK